MNRRQVHAAWILGAVLAAGPLFVELDVEPFGFNVPWLVGVVLPVLVLAPLILFALRTSSGDQRQEQHAAALMLGATLALAAFGLLVYVVAELADAVDTVAFVLR